MVVLNEYLYAHIVGVKNKHQKKYFYIIFYFGLLEANFMALRPVTLPGSLSYFFLYILFSFIYNIRPYSVYLSV